MKIAIVEDEIRIREGIAKLLTRADKHFEIVGEAENGSEGVALLMEKRPDLVIADVRMPEMDGIEMIEAIHAQGFQPVVIVLSAYSDFSYAQRAMKLGVNEYLVKPVVVDELIAAVRRAQEVVQRQAIEQHGLRSKSEVLSNALLDGQPLSEQLRDYARVSLGLADDTAFALLLVHPVQVDDLPPWDMVQALTALPETMGLCTPLSKTVQGNLPILWTDFGSETQLASKLEAKLLPLWRNNVSFVAQLGFCTGLEALHGLYQLLLTHMAYGLISEEAHLMRYPLFLSQSLALFSYPIELENAARVALAKRESEKVRARIQDFGKLFACGIAYAPRDIKEAHVRFAWALLSTARELGIHAAENLSRQAWLEKIMQAVHPAQLAALRQELAELLCGELSPSGERSLLVRRAERLMKDYYAQGITLDEIAQKLSVTPEYLSGQIHRETGVTFGTLMKRLRVERAKELFLTTDKKLYEIAELVGYADAKYFSKVFQGVTGMLPAEYRRMNK